MEPGATSDWEALQSIVLRTGNGAGVQVTVNDQELPPLGSQGEVVELRWDLIDGEIIQSTPSPTLPPQMCIRDSCRSIAIPSLSTVFLGQPRVSK